MKIMKRRLRADNLLIPLLLWGGFLIGAFPARAQSDAQFSQYFEVPNYYNAAAVGTTDLLKIRGGARLQWVGIQGAPKTFVVAADMPFMLFKKRFGVGLVMQQESMGLYKNLNLGAQVAYKQGFSRARSRLARSLDLSTSHSKAPKFTYPTRMTSTSPMTTRFRSKTYEATPLT